MYGMDSFLIILLGAVLTALGVLAYTGVWRAWAIRYMFLHNAGFASLYIGAGTLLLGIISLTPRDQDLASTLFPVWGPLLVGGVFAYFAMPAFLLPGWFKEGIEERKQLEETLEAERISQKKNRAP